MSSINAGAFCTNRFSLLEIDNNDCIEYNSDCTANTTFSTTDIQNDLNSGVFWLNYNIVKSPGDGHCLIHSVLTSLNFGLSAESNSNVNASGLFSKLTDETVKHVNRYVDFIDGNGSESLLCGLDEYIHDRKYDTSFGDLVPIILSNALSVNLLIVTKNGSRFEINLIECQFDAIENPHMLIVFKTGFHYDAIVPISLLVARTDQCTKSTSFESVRASHCASNVSQACNVPTIEHSVRINVSSTGQCTEPNSIECVRASHCARRICQQWDLPTIININARSLNMEKVDELQVVVDEYNISIACITETWFREYMDDPSLALEGFCLERKDRGNRRGGGVACYIRNDVVYNRLLEVEDEQLEVLWIKVMPKRLPRRFSCILVGCLYYTQETDFMKMREHVIMSIDTVTRKHPECGVVLTGDFNQFKDRFLVSHYRFVQVVNISTRGKAILDKIWTNMAVLYSSPISISELGKSDHYMILFRPNYRNDAYCSGKVTRSEAKCMGTKEKANFATALALVHWEPLFLLGTCEETYAYYKDIVTSLMDKCVTTKVVTRHTADKPWITDYYRCLIRKRQRAFMSGNRPAYRLFRNEVNRASVRLKFVFYQKHMLAITESGSRDWWKNMKKIMGLNVNSNSCIEQLANNTTNGDCTELANSMNDFFLSVTDHLPRLDKDHVVFNVTDELPDDFVISVDVTLLALQRVKTCKSTGPDNIPAWVLKDHAKLLAAPLTSIFNSSLRDGVLPVDWKMANVIPLPKTKPMVSVETDIRPISLTPIAAKVFESIVMGWVDDIVGGVIDDKQFGGVCGTSTTDALVEMLHKWYEATDTLNTFVRVVMLDFSKAFDLINHHLLLEKLTANGLPVHIVRWIAAFLLDRQQQVKIGNCYSHSGSPNGGVPQGTLSGPKCFLLYINDLVTNVPLYKYVDDSTLFETCHTNGISLIQDSVNDAVDWTSNNYMKINSKKSKEMIISFTRNIHVHEDVPNIVIEGNPVEQVEHAKLLGVILSNDLTWNKHVDSIVKKAAKRVYMLYQLKRAGICQTDLVTVYISVVRPVLEYACPVWHTNLPKYLSDNIEMIQKRAMKSIFPGKSYDDILNAIGMCTLHDRRNFLCAQYFKCMQVKSHKLNHLLPEQRCLSYDMRSANMYPLPLCRTNRYRNSLIPWGLNNWQDL